VRLFLSCLLVGAAAFAASARADGVREFPHRMASDHLYDTAITTHTPESHALLAVTYFSLGKLKNNEPAKALSCQVDARDSSRDVNVDGGVDSALWVPSAAKQAVAKGRFEHSLLPCPIAKVLTYPAGLDDMRVPTVSRLLRSSRPPTIVRGVGTIVVDTVYGVPRCRFRPHVSDEVGEAIWTEPTVTDSYPARSIVGPPCIAWISTASENVLIGIADGMSCHDVPPASTLRGELGAGAAGMRFSGATLALRQRTTSDRERQG
jgi:hypothetical protein